MAEQVALFKMSTGEEIIARYDSNQETEEQIVLGKPRVIMIVPGQQPGEMGMQLVPFMAGNQDGDIAIFKNQIVATTGPTPDLEQGYVQNTTGIDLSSQMP